MAVKPPSKFSLSILGAYARQGIIYIGAFLVALMVGRIMLNFAVSTWKRMFPAPPPPPTMGFDLLPLPTFPKETARPQEWTWDAVGKRFPSFGVSAPVYEVSIPKADLLALDRAQETAAALGFLFTPERVGTNQYRWRRSEGLSATLEMDIVSRGLSMTTEWPSNVALLAQRQIPAPVALTAELRTILRSVDYFPDEIATATPTLTYLKAVGNSLQPVASQSDADFVQADMYRTSPDGQTLLTYKSGQGPIRVLFSGSRERGERILGLDFFMLPINWAAPETYPLRSPAQAWQSLAAGAGFVLSNPPDGTATGRNVRLIYMEPSMQDQYLQPFYLFTGDEGFAAIAPALEASSFSNIQN